MGKELMFENKYYQLFVENEIISLRNKKGGAAILPLTADNKVLLLNIYRRAIGKYVLEVPRGFGEDGEEACRTAQREMLEEMSCTSEEIVPLGKLFVDSGLLSVHTDLFLGLNTTVLEDKVQAEEGIKELKAFEYKEVFDMVMDGRINDSFTIAVFMRSLKCVGLARLLNL